MIIMTSDLHTQRDVLPAPSNARSGLMAGQRRGMLRLLHDEELTAEHRELLASRGFSPEALLLTLRSASVLSVGKMYRGIGLRNGTGGLEFQPADFSTAPFTIGLKGLVLLPCEAGHRSLNCLLFDHFMSYLAFLSMPEGHPARLLRQCDVVVMGPASNFDHAVRTMAHYHQTICFFRKGTITQTVIATLRDLLRTDVADGSFLYGHHDSFADFIANKENTTE